MELKISLPLYIEYVSNPNAKRAKPRFKKFILNLNNYRKIYRIQETLAKHAYKEFISEDVKSLGINPYKHYRLEYIYYHGSANIPDVSNPCSIIDKYFSDALTELGFWPDDNINILKKTSYEWGGIDRKNPRCDVIIKSYD